MSRSSKYFLLQTAVFCALACRLLGEPITLAASSAAVSGTFCISSGVWCRADLSANGPSFTLFGTSYYRTSSPALPGLDARPTFFVPYQTWFVVEGSSFGPFGPVSGFGPTFVGGEFPGSTRPVFSLYFGFVRVNATPFVLTCPSPETTAGCSDSSTIIVSAGGYNLPLTASSRSGSLVLPATITGSFSACGTPLIEQLACLAPPLGTVSVDLPGELVLTVSAIFSPFGPGVGPIVVSESFASTPVPEPASLFVAGLGFALTIAISLRRKSGSGQGSLHRQYRPG